jgi:hypothetical protein
MLEKYLVVKIYKLEMVAHAMMVAGAVYRWTVQHKWAAGQLISKPC